MIYISCTFISDLGIGIVSEVYRTLDIAGLSSIVYQITRVGVPNRKVVQ
jgi:hypothetical protein